MENACMTTHGATHLLNERLYKSSDPFVISVCGDCGFSVNKDECQCGSNNVRKVRIPYAAKLVMHEVNSMGIKTLFKSEAPIED